MLLLRPLILLQPLPGVEHWPALANQLGLWLAPEPGPEPGRVPELVLGLLLWLAALESVPDVKFQLAWPE